MSAEATPDRGPLILIVDDEDGLTKGLRLTFEREGFTVAVAGDGQAALEKAEALRPDLIILDLMLPVVSGFDVCRQLRSHADPALRGVPIIMLTARDDEIDKIVGLELGADDYVTKPFNSRELVARTRAALRRRDLDRAGLQKAGTGPDGRQPVLPAETGEAGPGASHGPGPSPSSPTGRATRFGVMTIDPLRRRVTVSGKPVSLTATEFDLLSFLAASPGRVYDREQLLSSVWGYEFAGADRTVDVHIRRLREKVEPDASRPTYVRTSWGKGYFFNDGLDADWASDGGRNHPDQASGEPARPEAGDPGRKGLP